ncbi:hypothetical protein F511_27897 [Dorcoceras hygrometricum]|nr:hypothetical protein F511_27897 [Dorcoceras hygrometricum]
MHVGGRSKTRYRNHMGNNGDNSRSKYIGNRTCYNCGEKGHYKADCPHPKEDKYKRDNTLLTEQSNNATDLLENYDDVF